MSATTRAILTNSDVLAVDQDWGGRQGYKVRDDGDQEVWAKPMSNGSVAVVLFNRGSGTTTVSTTATQVGLAATGTYSLKDLWSKATSQSSGTISAPAPSHGAVMYQVSGAGLGSPSASPSRTASASPSASPSRSTGSSPSASTTPTGPSGATCTAAYQVTNSWPGGFQGAVTVTNTGTRATTSWMVTWTFRDGQVIGQAWNGTATQSGAAVSATNASYNGALSAGATTSLGFIATWTAANQTPTDLACRAS
jgi:alpha-galactosidase